MPDSESVDLSKLTIPRKEEIRTPPTRSRTGLILYIGGALFLAFSIFFFVRTATNASEEIEVTTVSMISPSQANSVLTASGYVAAQRKAAVASKATGRCDGDVHPRARVRHHDHLQSRRNDRRNDYHVRRCCQ